MHVETVCFLILRVVPYYTSFSTLEQTVKLEKMNDFEAKDATDSSPTTLIIFPLQIIKNLTYL